MIAFIGWLIGALVFCIVYMLYKQNTKDFPTRYEPKKKQTTIADCFPSEQDENTKDIYNIYRILSKKSKTTSMMFTIDTQSHIITLQNTHSDDVEELLNKFKCTTDIVTKYIFLEELRKRNIPNELKLEVMLLIADYYD